MTPGLPLAILAGVVGAGLMTLGFGTAGGPLLAYFAPLPILLAGLCLGVPAAALAGVTASAVIGVMIGGFGLLLFAACIGAPAVFVVRQALLSRPTDDGVEWYPAGRILAWLAAYGTLGLALVALAFASEPGGLAGAVDGVLAAIAQEAEAVGGEVRTVFETLRAYAGLLPAMTVGSWLIMLALNALLAQAIAARLGRARRPSPDIAAVEAPRWCRAALALGAVAALLPASGIGVVGRGAFVVFLVPYLFVGLGFVHLWLRRTAHARLGLAAFYFALVLLAWPLAPAVAALGLADDVARLRRRLVP